MLYRKLRRVWSHNNYSYIPKFTQTFPELRNLSYDELCERWKSLGVDFYTEEKIRAKWWIRLTLPFALIVLILMILFLPFNFVLTGVWNYDLSEKNKIINWFRALRIFK